MPASTFLPFNEANQDVSDTSALTARFSDDGYLFFRGLLDKRKVEDIRDSVVAVLKRYGFVDQRATSEPLWSGKWPERNELSPDGVVTRAITRMGLMSELAQAKELMDVLGRILGGNVLCWTDNKGRIRMMLGGKKSFQVAGGPKFSFSTPGHQDYYFFRPVQFCTVWIPLMDIDQSVGGLALEQHSHREGLHEVWWRGKEYLGVAENRKQAREWRKSGGVVVAGTTKPKDGDKVWLRSNYQLGDVLIFHPLMMHAGLPNTSDKVRISTDFRYQRQGTQTNWESQHSMVYSSKYFGEVFQCLDSLGVAPGLYEMVWERMRLEGPSRKKNAAIATRIQEHIQDLTRG
jgi:hypothetical protein